MTTSGNNLFFVQTMRGQSSATLNPALEKLPGGASPIKGGLVADALYETIATDSYSFHLQPFGRRQ